VALRWPRHSKYREKVVYLIRDSKPYAQYIVFFMLGMPQSRVSYNSRIERKGEGESLARDRAVLS
jgi:hypothetical protein